MLSRTIAALVAMQVIALFASSGIAKSPVAGAAVLASPGRSLARRAPAVVTAAADGLPLTLPRAQHTNPRQDATATNIEATEEAAPVLTPAPRIDSLDFNKARFVQTTYYSCVTRGTYSHCGWHEPILDASSTGSRSLGAGVIGRSNVLWGLVAVVWMWL